VYDGPIIDAHTHPMLDPESQIVAVPHPPEAYRGLVDGSQVCRAAALTIAHGDDLDRTRTRNDAVIKLAKDSDRFFYLPVCSVHPADGLAALREIDRVAAAGAAWLKLHPNTQRFDVADPAVAMVVRKAAEHGLPVLFDAYSPWDANQPGKYVNLAIAVPEARLILAHAHGPGFPQLLFYDVLAPLPGVAAERVDRYLGDRPRCLRAARSPSNSPGCCARWASTASSSAATTRSTNR